MPFLVSSMASVFWIARSGSPGRGNGETELDHDFCRAVAGPAGFMVIVLGRMEGGSASSAMRL